MSREFITNDLKQKTLNSINNRAEEAYQKMQEKREAYEFAMKKFSIFKQKREVALTKFKAQKGTYTEDEAKMRYKNIDRQTSDYEINTDVLRESLRRDISFCAKMNNSAFIANSILS